MAGTIERLSTKAVEKAKPGPTKRPKALRDGGGLYLQVTKGAGRTIDRSWLFRFSTTKLERERGMPEEGKIGSAAPVTGVGRSVLPRPAMRGEAWVS